MNSNSGMHKPPLAPKPKIVQPQRGGFYSFPRRDGLPLSPSGTPKRVKPALAPKPTLPKITAGVESKPISSKSDIPKIIGLLNSKNGIQQENKKPDWDYIIPICLCSPENCLCVGNTADRAVEQLDRGLQKLNKGKIVETPSPVPRSRGRLDTREEKTDNAKCQTVNSNHLQSVCLQTAPTASTCSHLHKHNHLQNKRSQTKIAESLDRNVKTTKDLSNHVAAGRPSPPHRTWSNEVNANSLGGVGQGPEKDPIGSNHKPTGPQTRPSSLPAATPRKAALAHQENVAEDRAEKAGREEKNAKEVNLSAERKSSPPRSVSGSGLLQDTSVSGTRLPPLLSARRACPPPAPLPRKKPFLSAPEKTPASAPRSLPQDVEKEDLGWDNTAHETECSVDKPDEEVDGEKARGDAEHIYSDIPYFPPSSGQFSKPQPSCQPQRHCCPTPWMLKKKAEEGKLVDHETGQERVTGEWPLTPDKKAGTSTLEYPGAPGPCRSSLNKQKAKSFSAADFIYSERWRRNSFRKLLDLTLSVKMFPRQTVAGGQTLDCTAGEMELCVDSEYHDVEHCEQVGVRKLSCPHIGVEQSVDGDDLYLDPDPDSEYDNIALYEEITDYMNLPIGVTAASPEDQQLAVWQSLMYNDENIYEEQEPYLTQEETRRQQRDSVSGRGSAQDAVRHDGIFMAQSSDEEDYQSSASSKGDPELAEDREVESGPKKSKIHHIATEIMSSESVFVDVLKLLNVDFRDAVSKASSQCGKPVIEERILNQILYYLPQLYELNQDLLKELQQRVVKWDENDQLADIFVKKGPYLKMYSTYIREFDKNVALLDEQTKRNPAFGTVVREFEASPRCANLALRHYLLKPVQRIPQYQLLLTDYLKNLSIESADYKDTEAALGIVKEVANHANDIMKQGDNFQKMMQVQCSLNGHHEIVQPGRVFLKKGILKKLSRKIMQPRMFFLFNDALFYTTPVQSGQYKLNSMLSLAGMKVSKPSQEAYQNELNIESVERSFILSASSATERDEWLHAISKAISDYTKKKISFISGKSLEEVEPINSGTGAPLGSTAPIWIPDPRTTMCMICTCEFTLTWRRHHCRACGKVVCQSCSTNKHSLEYLKNQLARVCDLCFPVLQQQRNDEALSTTLSPGNKSTFAFSRRQKKIPAALKEVSANTNSSMSGYLQRSKGNKKQGKRLWFVIKDKVLYTYAASEDVAALESQPLLGFVLKEDSSQSLQFKLYHKNTLFYMFKADDNKTAQRWIDSFKEATVL